MSATLDGLSIVVPCMNEIGAVPELTRQLEDLARRLAPRPVELIFVDDGSTDGTGAALREHCGEAADRRVLAHSENLGLGAALATGYEDARHPMVATLDADLSYDPDLVLAMIPRIEAGADLVTASPYHPEGGVDGVAGWRLALSRSASAAYRRLLHTRLHTYTAMVRLARTAAVRDLRPRSRGFVAVIELLALLDRRGGRIEEIPARLGVRRTGVSKMRTLRTIRGHLGFMCRLAFTRGGDRHD